MNRKIYTCAGADELAATAAAYIASLALDAVSLRGRCTIVLAGGSTPEKTYRSLSSEKISEKIPWEQVHLFWGDERFVHLTDRHSNYRMADEALLSRVPVPVENVHPVPVGSETPEQAARKYEQTLRGLFLGDDLRAVRDRTYPVFDLVILGVGADGHTASLYEVSSIDQEERRWVISTRGPDTHPVRERVSLSLPVINSARSVLFLVSGEEKREALQRMVSRADGSIPVAPAQMVQPARSLVLMTDVGVRGF
ncbi:MAG: 6-phosphogluconolactonase [Spirochaetota bacterium]